MTTRTICLAGTLFLLCGGLLSADDPQASEPSDDGKTYRLQYSFAPGDVFRCRVTHLVSVETKIRGVTETAKTRSVSTKTWRIEEVAENGEITFTYSIEDAKMWQQLSGRQEIRYDSATDEEPPAEYKHVADLVGVPMATVTIDPTGRIVDREDARAQFNPGIGDLTMRLPDQPVRVGQQWATEGETVVRLPDARVKRIKTRQVYQLTKVQTGVATIEVQTQILTPVNDPVVESQLVQRIKRGEVKFDIDAGRVLSQQMDIDETVVGFNGPDSIMKYLARLSEEATDGPPDESSDESSVAGSTDNPLR
jgi:hypothetical protein